MNYTNFETEMNNSLDKEVAKIDAIIEKISRFNIKHTYDKLPTCNKDCIEYGYHDICHSHCCVNKYITFKKNIMEKDEFKEQNKIALKRFKEDADFYQYLYKNLPTCDKNCIKEDNHNLVIHTKECLQNCRKNIKEFIEKPLDKYDNPNTTTGPYTLWNICTNDCYHHILTNGCVCKKNLKMKLIMVEKLLDENL